MESITKPTVAVLFGSRSVEHEISIITAIQMLSAANDREYNFIPVYLDLNNRWFCDHSLRDPKIFLKNIPDHFEVNPITKNGKFQLEFLKKRKNRILNIDVCFFCFHGEFGEDGSVQGLVNLSQVAFTGSGLMSSSICMNKYITKQLLKSENIPVVESYYYTREELQDKNTLYELLSSNWSYPLIVKPNHLGSSVGVSKVENKEELLNALALVFLYDYAVLIEPCVTPLMEINISILEGGILSVLEIPITTEKTLSYQEKYLRGGKQGDKISNESKEKDNHGMAALNRIIDPQDLNIETKELVEKYALKAYKLLQAAGVVRIDFLMNKQSGEIFFNEINPMPGSMAYYLWEKSRPKKSLTQIIDLMIHAAMERAANKRCVQRNFGFLALKNFVG